MINKDWNPNNLILRDYLRVLMLSPILEKIPIKSTDHVLEIGIRNFFVLKKS